MKMDGKINKKELLYKRALITCIIMLFVSIVLKLFGSTLFSFDTNIPMLQKIDDIIMTNIPLSFMYSFILMFINSMLVFMIVTKRRPDLINICSLSLFSIGIIMYKWIYGVSIISFILETIVLLLICILETNEVSIAKEFTLAFVLNIIYQMISLFIRDLGFQLSLYGLVISVLFLIDYYIMLVITYLFLKKGDMTLCLTFRHYGSYLANLLWKRHITKSKQCSSKCEHDG